MSTATFDPAFVRPARPGRSCDRVTTLPTVTARRTALQLTRRGRLVVVVAALLVAFVIGVFVAAAGSVATEQPGTPAPTRIVQVHEGDTLWDIAAGLTRDGDVRATMATIQQLNAMGSNLLHAGQRLVVPAA